MSNSDHHQRRLSNSGDSTEGHIGKQRKTPQDEMGFFKQYTLGVIWRLGSCFKKQLVKHTRTWRRHGYTKMRGEKTCGACGDGKPHRMEDVVMQIKMQDAMQRQELLIRLAGENWEEFVIEWEQQMGFWLQEIREVVKDPMAGRRAFDIIEEAQNMLRMCGKRAFAEHGARTTEMLLEPIEEAIGRLY
ncbi:MAG: hypothetical protein LLF89_08135 [Spirochaetaceae bacterium]|nr:hypothetical protein [Spirochaetaceae bacterium]